MQTLHRKKYTLGSRSETVFQQLRDLAAERGPEFKLPTTRELCEQFNASSVTITHALDRLEKQNVIYRKPRSGIFVSPKLNCKNIHVLINASLVDGESVSPFWGILWGKLVKEGQNRAVYKNEEIHFQLTASDPDNTDLLPPDVMRAIDAGQIHGVLSIGMDDPLGYLTVGEEIPMVSYAGPGYWQVGIYEDHTTMEAVQRLSNEGCTRIGYWSHFGFWSHSKRQTMAAEFEFGSVGNHVEFFQSALAGAGLQYYPELFRSGAITFAEVEGNVVDAVRKMSSESYQEQGYLSAMRAFAPSRTVQPDGLVIADDMLTSGALIAFNELGIRPGIDVKIASHSNAGSPLLYGWEKKLILWQTDAGEIVSAMFNLLDRIMAGEHPDPPLVNVPLRFRD